LAGKELELELFTKSETVNIVCITEHWLKDFRSMTINNFQLGSIFLRSFAIHGGSLIFVNDNIHKYKERKDVVDLSRERIIEISCVELESHVVVCVYRPPSGDFAVFESVMDDVLNKLCNKGKSVVVCGDFNINILEDTPIGIRFLAIFKSYNLVNQFLEPTRITSHSATCLDNIFSNENPVSKSVITNLTSDHCGLLIVFPNKLDSEPRIVTYRPITDKRIEVFQNKIDAKLNALPYKHGDPDDQYKNLFNLISNEFDHCFKVQTIKSTSGKIRFDDWATRGIYKSRNRLYELYALKKYNKNVSFVEYVKRYSKTFKIVCTLAKSLYIRNKINKSNNKIKTTWNIINRETGKSKTHNTQFTLNHNNKLIKSESDIADIFEDYFTNIPVNLTSKLSSSSKEAGTMLRMYVPECSETFVFKYVDSINIIKTFKLLKLKNTGDLWDISVKVIKNIIHSIAPYLAVIFNNCVDEGTFPDLMKYSKVIPLFKSGNKEDASNFRPISILPALSKIFEKIILDQLVTHFSTNKLFHEAQFGFIKGRSTTDAGVMLLRHIFDAWEGSQNALGVFCDLSKAFDCVDYQTLICKLQHYGVKNIALKLLFSYLNSRTQIVDINGIKSSGSRVTMGVPQGSILGPFLFLIYINDLPFFAEKYCDIVLFADDTSLIFKYDRNKTNFDDVNNALSKIVSWFTINNLQLNATKTKCIKFALPNVKQINVNIKLNDVTLNLIEHTSFLGITVDSKLQWNPQITSLACKLGSAVYAIKKIRQYTDIATARTVYFSYFHSIMSYGILLWGKAADIETVFILQKRAIRAIYCLTARTSLKDLFKEIKILTVASQYIYNCILFTRLNINLYRKHSDNHSINTRNKDKLILPTFRLHKVSNSFLGQGVMCYNKIPDSILELPHHKFKTHIKSILMSKGYYSVKDYLDDKNAWL
jgi:hypothetical protein